jgi:hypothetical protein
MIKSNTVFVLGAGASVPYGYPTGAGLIEKVISVACNEEVYKAYHQCLTPEKRFSSALALGDFAREFQRLLIDANPASIDYFLKLRGEYMGLGKVAIAYVIKACAMALKASQQNIAGSDWYSYLRNMIFEDTFAETCNNRIAFITFNYDTSLEEYFYKQLEYYYPGSNKEAFFKHITIEHIHGKIHRLPWERNELPDMTIARPALRQPLDSTPHLDADMIKNMATGIRLYHEGEDDSVLKSISRRIREAEKAFYLGFGFHKDNVAKLNNNKGLKRGLQNCLIFSTRFGLTDSEWNAKKRDSGLHNLTREGKKEDDCLSLLKSCAEFLT